MKHISEEVANAVCLVKNGGYRCIHLPYEIEYTQVARGDECKMGWCKIFLVITKTRLF